MNQEQKHYHVHICCVGSNVDPSIAFTRSNLKKDAVYLICAKDNAYSGNPDMNRRLKAAENEIERILKDNGISKIEKKRVDSWDFQAIVDCVLDIAAEAESIYPNVRFYINMTSGTHVMTGAVSCAAFYIGAELYYVLSKKDHPGISSEDEIRRYEIPFLPDVNRIKGIATKVLFYLYDNGPSNNRSLLEDIDEKDLTPSKLGHHTGSLKELRLIEGERIGKETKWTLTYSGKVAVRIMRRPSKIRK